VGPGTSFVAREATTLSPTLLNEFTFSYTEDHIFLNPSGNNWQRPSSMTMTGFLDNGFGGKLPGLQIDNGAPRSGRQDLGSHNTYTGFYLALAQKNEDASVETQGYLNFSDTSPISSDNAWADLLLGRVSNFSQTNQQIKYYYRDKVFEP
jgi:hypothetical protein